MIYQPSEIINVNHENKPIEIISSVTHQRVEHYADIVEMIARIEVARCQAAGFNPSPTQIAFLKKEIVRYAVIRRDIETAQSLRIKKAEIL